MKRRGFTLIELLGVITLIGLMGLLVVPAVNKSIKDFKEDAYDKSIKSIELSARNWASDNYLSLPSNIDEVTTITLSTLKISGYIDNSLVNPKTNKQFPNDMLIEIKKTSNKNYSYTVIKDSGTGEGTETNNRAPIIVLKGSSTDYFNYSSSSTNYTDPGYTVTDADGKDLSSENIVKTKITNSSGNAVSNISSSSLGTYVIKYTASYNNMSTVVTRTVIVRDMQGPTITVNGKTTNQTVTVNKGSAYTVPSATVSDNVDSASNITLTRNVNSVDTSKKGTHPIIYKATDKAGNTTTLTVKVIVS